MPGSRAAPAVLLPCGDTAVLVEVGGIDEVLALRAAIESARDRLAGLADLVPAATTLLVVAESPAALPALRSQVASLVARHVESPAAQASSRRQGASGGSPTAAADEVRIEVRYDGEDLHAVARHTGLTPAEVVAAHTSSTWTAAFSGFAPGFAYLAGGDRRLEVPRREEPRTRVPAGAVGLAGPFSGIYPRSSPGGWHIIGHTDVVLWEIDRDPPALLRPGVRVRFVAVQGPGVAAEGDAAEGHAAEGNAAGDTRHG